MSAARQNVQQVARAALAAVPSILEASTAQLDDALELIAGRLETERDGVLDANEKDVASARGRLSSGLVDRLRLDEARLRAVAGQVRSVIALPPVERVAVAWRQPNGLQIEERRVPIGVVGAVYEARPNVTVDVATQLLKSRNAGVLRTGSAALATATAIVELVVRPSLAGAGLDPDAVGLVRVGDHDGAEELVSMPDVVPLVILRGSGETTRRLARLAAREGVRTLQHADGGGVLYVHSGADLHMTGRLIGASLDRLGVCNRLNWLLLDQAIHETFLPAVLQTLETLGVSPSLPPYDHPLSHEWALDPERDAVVTIVTVGGLEEALEFAHTETSGLAAAIVSDDEVAAGAFLDGYRGAGAFWNASTRWLDGYQLSGAPETGINIDKVPGPRGPVTYRDLYLRQYVVTGDGTQTR